MADEISKPEEEIKPPEDGEAVVKEKAEELEATGK